MNTTQYEATPDEQWQTFLGGQQKFQGRALETWLRPLRCIRFDADKIVLEARDPFFRAWVLDHYLEPLAEEFAKHGSHQVIIEILINHDLRPQAEDPAVMSWSPKVGVLDAEVAATPEQSIEPSSPREPNNTEVMAKLDKILTVLEKRFGAE